MWVGTVPELWERLEVAELVPTESPQREFGCYFCGAHRAANGSCFRCRPGWWPNLSMPNNPRDLLAFAAMGSTARGQAEQLAWELRSRLVVKPEGMHDDVIVWVFRQPKRRPLAFIPPDLKRYDDLVYDSLVSSITGSMKSPQHRSREPELLWRNLAEGAKSTPVAPLLGPLMSLAKLGIFVEKLMPLTLSFSRTMGITPEGIASPC